MLPIADRWFERRTVSPDLTLLTEPHVDPLLRCNIWHVRGRDRDLVIDTGLGITQSARCRAGSVRKTARGGCDAHAHGSHRRHARIRRTLGARAGSRRAGARQRSAIPLDLRDYDAETLAMFAAIGYEIAGGHPHGDPA